MPFPSCSPLIDSHLHKQWDQVYQLLVAIQVQNRKGEQSLDDNQKGKTKFLAAGVIGAYQGSPNLLSAKSLFFQHVLSHWCLSDLHKTQWTKLISIPATDINVGKKVLKFWDRYANMVLVSHQSKSDSHLQVWFLAGSTSPNEEQTIGPAIFTKEGLWDGDFSCSNHFITFYMRRQKASMPILIGMQCIN